MLKKCAFYTVILSALMAMPAAAVTTRNTGARSATASPAAAYNYNYMYPYLNNQMRTDLNPGVTPSQAGNPISVITKTEQLSAPRRVVSRSAARSATKTSTGTSSATRSATTGTNVASTASSNNTSTRRVVARSGVRTTGTAARSTRGNASTTYQSAVNATTAAASNTDVNLSSTRCLADYTECMNGYCQRENTAYNRCYCSAKLAQIDAEYQPAIDNLIQQILRLQSTNTWSDEEMNEYWMSTIGKYTGDNSWVNLDNALNINWAGTESRVRGQQTFATGHDYCVQHLRGCAYMATNMRDAYRSEIARDCTTYESGLAKIKNAAESIVESYSD